MAQSLADLAREQAEKKRVADAATAGLAAAAPPKSSGTAPTPPTSVKIVGGGKTPKEIEHERARQRHQDAVKAQGEKAKQKKAEKTGSLR